MESKKFLLVVLISVLISFILYRALTSKIRAPSTPEIVLRFAESMPRNHPAAMSSRKFANTVYERSGGKIQIKVYYDGQLGNESAVLEQIQFGGIAFAHVNFASLAEEFPALERYIEPFKYGAADEMMEHLEGDGEFIAKALEYTNILPLVFYDPDIRCIANVQGIIREPKDFIPLTLKIPQSRAIARFIKRLGAEAITILTGDVYRSLSRGFIDGMETTLFEYYLNEYYTIMPFLNLTKYIYCPDIIVASGVSVGSLSRRNQTLIRRCAEESALSHQETLSMLQKSCFENLETKGIQIDRTGLLDASLREAILIDGM
jgi:TRAP-type C4-dicarboxylate transport system substrate-binding protein